MNNRRSRLVRAMTLFSLCFLLFSSPSPAEASTLVVNTIDDHNDGTCDANHCSLREAIQVANIPGPDTITFNIPGFPFYYIEQLCDALPPIVDPGTTIDGTTQPGYTGIPLIVIRPVQPPNTVCPSPVRGFLIRASNTTIKGLSINGYQGTLAQNSAGIVIESGQDNSITQNWIGIDPSGPTLANRVGIWIKSQGQSITSNMLADYDDGILIHAGDQDIRSNFIGTDPSGMTTFPGIWNVNGIVIESGADGVRVGGSGFADGNVIAGHTNGGIVIHSDDNTVQGNKIGTNRFGDSALPNDEGIIIHGNGNTIGGPFPSQGNLISGNSGNPIRISSSASANVIIGNKIGTDHSGSAPLGNAGSVLVGGWDHVIGGADPGEGNVISYNTGPGIFMEASGVQVIGNTITDNREGVVVLAWISNAWADTISHNSIYANTNLGIDLITHPTSYGVTPNDPGDADDGPNTLLNFPEFTSTGPTGVSGTTCPGCTVELFESDDDPSGHGEGRTFVDETVADASGNFNFPLNLAISHCNRLTATATDSDGNTSEFSETVRIGICLLVDPRLLLLFSFLPIALGLVIGGAVGNFSKVGLGKAVAVGITSGVAISAGVVGLAIGLPGVHIERVDAGRDIPLLLPSCSQYLDPDGFSPSDGEWISPDTEIVLSWSPTENLPTGHIRWRVDLQDSSYEFSQTTTETMLPYAAFNHPGTPMGWNYWRLIGELAASEAAEYEPFCSERARHYFFIHHIIYMLEPGAEETEPSHEPTRTSTPTSTPTITMTPTSEPEVCVYEALQNANCRASDYVESAQIAILLQGELAELIGLNPEYSHGMFKLQNQQQCWIWLGLLDGPPNPFGTCDVPVVDPPPKPTDTPTPLACRPDLDQEACEASGGEWSGEVVGATGCVCPE